MSALPPTSSFLAFLILISQSVFDYLSEFPASEREQQRAIINDQIVDAGHLKGLIPGNADGDIPINNGNVNVNLNADTLDGKHSSFFSPDGHRHDNATTNSDGYLCKEDKEKLDTVATVMLSLSESVVKEIFFPAFIDKVSCLLSACKVTVPTLTFAKAF